MGDSMESRLAGLNADESTPIDLRSIYVPASSLNSDLVLINKLNIAKCEANQEESAPNLPIRTMEQEDFIGVLIQGAGPRLRCDRRGIIRGSVEAAAHFSQHSGNPASQGVFQHRFGEFVAVPSVAAPRRSSGVFAREAHLSTGADILGRTATAPALGVFAASPAAIPAHHDVLGRTATAPPALCAGGDGCPPLRREDHNPPPLVAPTRPAPAFLPPPAPPAHPLPPEPDSLPEEVCAICLEALTRGPAARCSSRRSAAHLVASLEAAGLLRLPGAPPTRAPAPPPPPEKGATAPCGHVFHAACITVTMAHAFAARRRPQCPLCRACLLARAAAAKPRAPARRAPTPSPAAPPPAAGPEWPVLVAAARRAGRAGRVRWGWVLVRQFLAACCVVGGATCVGLLVRYIK
jgi:hypothetical protein